VTPSTHTAPEVELVLVPGGAGFVGSHLCDRLIARGLSVLALDDLSTGDAAHVAHLARHAHARFRLLVHDLATGLPPEARAARRVYNLACPASPAHYRRRPVQTTLTSVLGAWHLLEHAQATGARLLQASTSEVYGDPEVHPQREEYWGHVNPIGERSCYDEGKRCAEALAFAYRRERGVAIRVARIFNTYGPRLTPGDGRVVSNFVVQALRGEPLSVYGQGRQTRSFCYVDDTVEGLLRLMDAPHEGPFNIGNPREHSVLELAELVLRLAGSRSRLEHLPLPADDPRRRKPDISAARAALGWEPRVALEDGLARTIEWFRVTLDLARPRVVLPAPAAA
jgi:UDP-glucuronate decarboxylase